MKNLWINLAALVVIALGASANAMGAGVSPLLAYNKCEGGGQSCYCSGGCVASGEGCRCL